MCLCLLCFVQECPDPSLGGWVLPDARISYTGESGSEIVETFPEDRVFHAPLPEGVQAVCTFYLCTLLISFFFLLLLTFLFQVPARTANAMVGVINRLKSALVRARSALSCRSPHSTRVMCPLFSFDLYLLFGFLLLTLFLSFLVDGCWTSRGRRRGSLGRGTRS